MSITDSQHGPATLPDPSSTVWAPEINDLQKYRDSLKIMAERVSQAEYMWAKSLEPPQPSQSSSLHSRRARKLSKTKRPTPLNRPALPKRICTDGAIFSPDPFQLLSPAIMSGDDPLSPSPTWSAHTGSTKSPGPRARDLYAGTAALSPTSPTETAQQPLLHAQDLLDDTIMTVAKTISRVNAAYEERSPVDDHLDSDIRNVSKQVRRTSVRVQSFLVEARRRSNMSSDSALFRLLTVFEDGNDDEDRPDPSDPLPHLVDLKARLKRWAQQIRNVREGLDQGAKSPSKHRYSPRTFVPVS